MLQRETRINCRRYQEIRREANKICKKKKKERMKRQLEEVNKFKDQSERRKFYKEIDNLTKGFQPRSTGFRNKDGEIIREEEKILRRWEEYFKALFDTEKGDENEREKNGNIQEETRTGRRLIREYKKVSKPTHEEIENAFKNKEQ
jgi:hypothetical protein